MSRIEEFIFITLYNTYFSVKDRGISINTDTAGDPPGHVVSRMVDLSLKKQKFEGK